MNYHTFVLDNGLRIIHRPTASPVVYCGYELNVGSRNEEPGTEGMAHFCEHATFKGTQRRRAWHILNRLESVGGDLNAFTNKEDTVYYVAILKEHVARAIDLLTDIVFHSTYPQSELTKEVEVICDEIESYNDTPAELIFDDFENTIFEGHPLGHNILGSAESVRSFTTEDARRFAARFYRPRNAVFFIDGDIDFKQVIGLLAKATADQPAHAPNSCETSQQTLHHNYRPRLIIKDKGTHQAHVMIGNRAYRTQHHHRTALYLLNNILGGSGMNARLNLSLREHCGLVYTVESTTASYADTGVWCIYFGCDRKDIDKCLRLIRRELNRLTDHRMTEYQLMAAKKQLKGQIGVACDNRESFALDFGKSFLHYGQLKDIGTLYRRIDDVTPQQIQQVAAEIMTEDRLTTLIYQ